MCMISNVNCWVSTTFGDMHMRSHMTRKTAKSPWSERPSKANTQREAEDSVNLKTMQGKGVSPEL